MAPSPGGGSANVSPWLLVALANVPVPKSLAGYQQVAPFSLASVSPSPSPGGTVGVTSRSAGGDEPCAVSVIDRPQAPSEGMRKVTLSDRIRFKGFV